jgi:hypothetical protein
VGDGRSFELRRLVEGEGFKPTTGSTLKMLTRVSKSSISSFIAGLD